MKKSSVTALIILALALAAAAGILIFRELNSPPLVPSESDDEETTYDEALYREFLLAEEDNDYIHMNTVYEKNMAETGAPFPGEAYDPTHDGKIYTYPYSVTVSKEEIAGKLYFVAKDVNLDALSANENDYFAVDYRTNSDPEVVVIDSYRAESEAVIRRLCEILLEHEENHPSDWDRTLESMVEEWQIHNAAYIMEYKVDHAKDVNLNNADENTDWVKRAAKELSDS